MRFRLAAAALAALAFATPAAAQPNALEEVRSVVQRLAANTEGVQDYTLSLRSGPMATDVYVYRGDEGEWNVASGGDEEIGGLLQSMVVWPMFGELDDEFPDPGEVSAEDLAEFSDIFNLSTATLEGRPANVLFLRMGELDLDDSEMPDSLQMFVDPETHQLLRVHVAGAQAEMGEFSPGGGGSMEITMDFSDYRETQGLTVPHALRLMMDVEMQMTAAQKDAVRASVAAAREELAQEDTPEARQTAAMIDIFLGLLTEGHLELPVTVEAVQVNTGPPSWFEG
jgi:hypothetical protein